MIVAAWICLISPLAAAFLITLAANRLSRRGAGYLATLSVAVSFVAAIVSFAGLLAQNESDPIARAEFVRQTRRMLLPLAIVAGLVALWSATAPLSGAVVANGQVKVELNRKTVQHQEGGIVREILVRDGERVRAGQPLVVVGDVRSDSELSLLQDQLRAARIRSARAEAEAALQSRFAAPADLAGQKEASEHLAREHALFTARRLSARTNAYGVA